MAEGIFKEMVKDSSEPWRVSSAGVYADPGYLAAENTLQVLKQRGIDLQEHRSRPITLGMIEGHALILTMERGHKEALQAAFPRFASRIFLVSEMVGEQFDIVDPVGQALVEYEDTARELESILLNGFERITLLAGASEKPDDQSQKNPRRP